MYVTLCCFCLHHLFFQAAKAKWANFALWHRLFFTSPSLGAGGSSISTAEDSVNDETSASTATGASPKACVTPVPAESADHSSSSEGEEEEGEDEVTWAPSPKRAKHEKTCPTDRKSRAHLKFEAIQDVLVKQESAAEKSRQAADKEARDHQHDVLLQLERVRSDAEDARAQHQRDWEDKQRKKQQEYDEKREQARRDYDDKKDRERREYEEKRENDREDLNQERRERELEFHAALLSKFCSK